MPCASAGMACAEGAVSRLALACPTLPHRRPAYDAHLTEDRVPPARVDVLASQGSMLCSSSSRALGRYHHIARWRFLNVPLLHEPGHIELQPATIHTRHLPQVFKRERLRGGADGFQDQGDQ